MQRSDVSKSRMLAKIETTFISVPDDYFFPNLAVSPGITGTVLSVNNHDNTLRVRWHCDLARSDVPMDDIVTPQTVPDGINHLLGEARKRQCGVCGKTVQKKCTKCNINLTTWSMFCCISWTDRIIDWVPTEVWGPPLKLQVSGPLNHPQISIVFIFSRKLTLTMFFYMKS